MQIFQVVLAKCIELFNTELTFAPFSFSIMQAFFALAALSIVISFIVKLMDR